jgi:hypothetical protein
MEFFTVKYWNSWKGGNGSGIITLDTVVVWTLEPKDNGTNLFLSHTGYKEENLSIFLGMDKGWFEKLKKIEELANKNSDANTNV